jgi:hypothetical protein
MKGLIGFMSLVFFAALLAYLFCEDSKPRCIAGEIASILTSCEELER